MAMCVLEFKPEEASQEHPTRLEWTEPAHNLNQARSRQTPAAIVVPRPALDHLRKLGDLVIDRGTKHKAKGLSEYLLNNSTKSPLIDGNFAKAGQTRRSLRVLLNNAVREGEKNLYLIGVDEEIFDELQEGAASVVPVGGADAESPSGRFGSKIFPGPLGAPASAPNLLNLLDEREISRASRVFDQKLKERYLGESVEIRLVRKLILRAAPLKEPVLILGPTGSGKEIVARAIHDYGPHQLQTYMWVNCSAIPHDLLESELFGSEKGAYTGAVDKDGLWELAGSGTLLLDEIGDLTPQHQAKILRALQENKIRRVGGDEDIEVNARVIAATHRNLFAMVRAGQFREDLYYRLRHFLIETPSLRDHPEDISMMAQSFWKGITSEELNPLPEAIMDELVTHPWPGNVRELKAVLSELHGLFGPESLRVEHLRAVLHRGSGTALMYDGGPMENEFMRHRVECLRHLRRADEVVRACQLALRPVVADKTSLDANITPDAVVGRYLGELQMLCMHPLLFHSEAAFTTVYRLKGKLAYFLSLVEANRGDALHYWRQELRHQFKPVLSALFQEVERVLNQSLSAG